MVAITPQFWQRQILAKNVKFRNEREIKKTERDDKKWSSNFFLRPCLLMVAPPLHTLRSGREGGGRESARFALIEGTSASLTWSCKYIRRRQHVRFALRLRLSVVEGERRGQRRGKICVEFSLNREVVETKLLIASFLSGGCFTVFIEGLNSCFESNAEWNWKNSQFGVAKSAGNSFYSIAQPTFVPIVILVSLNF